MLYVLPTLAFLFSPAPAHPPKSFTPIPAVGCRIDGRCMKRCEDDGGNNCVDACTKCR